MTYKDKTSHSSSPLCIGHASGVIQNTLVFVCQMLQRKHSREVIQNTWVFASQIYREYMGNGVSDIIEKAFS